MRDMHAWGHRTLKVLYALIGLMMLSCAAGSESPTPDSADSELNQDLLSLDAQGTESHLTPYKNCGIAEGRPLQDPPHGLVPAQRVALPIDPPMGAGHLADFVTFEDKIFVANSFDGIATFELTSDGKLESVRPQVLGTIRP